MESYFAWFRTDLVIIIEAVFYNKSGICKNSKLVHQANMDMAYLQKLELGAAILSRVIKKKNATLMSALQLQMSLIAEKNWSWEQKPQWLESLNCSPTYQMLI